MLSGDVTISPQDLATALCRHARTEAISFPNSSDHGIWAGIPTVTK
jgi:hypothetical protein